MPKDFETTKFRSVPAVEKRRKAVGSSVVAAADNNHHTEDPDRPYSLIRLVLSYS